MRLIVYFFSLVFVFNVHAKLLLVGGGNRPVEALREFLIASGGEKSQIVIIPWASESEDGSIKIKEELNALIKSNVNILPLDPEEDEAVLVLKYLNSATGIFFAGGDQNKLMNRLKKLQLLGVLRNLFQKGSIFGGTSAGTAIMSQLMLMGDSDLTVLDSKATKLSTGLGLLNKGIIVDQHFVKRMRFNRLAGLILDGYGNLGIGIDENTAIWLDSNHLKVFGEGTVLFIKSKTFNSLDIKILKAGDSIDPMKDVFFTSSLLIF